MAAATAAVEEALIVVLGPQTKKKKGEWKKEMLKSSFSSTVDHARTQPTTPATAAHAFRMRRLLHLIGPGA